ncbi:glycolate oxidase, subunit GlcD [Streptomyces sp. C]|nr:glycolate oxidase, subunit GlcD [Streptomyces sp. C]
MPLTSDTTSLLLERLRSALPAQALLTDPAELAAHSRDSAPFSACGTPAVVAVPRTAEQVEHVMRTAYALDVPVVPQGARTGLAGAANAVDGCVVLSTAAMDRILSVDPANRLVRCEPGVTTRRLAEAVAEHGLTYPPDPASWDRCTIGGNIATGAGGICCVKYGVTADYVLGLDLVLPDGRRMRTGRDTAKGVAGYDLTRLVVGSEGTLAVVVGATLALRPARPPALSLLAQFPTLTAAGDAVAAITAAGHTPSALELLDRATTRAIVDLGTHPLLRPGSAATLIVESDCADPSAELSAMEILCKEAGAEHIAASATSEEAYEIIEARRLVSPALAAYMASRGGGLTAFIEDVAVPRTALPTLIGRIEEIARAVRPEDLHPRPRRGRQPAPHGRLRRVRRGRVPPRAEAYDAIMAPARTGRHHHRRARHRTLKREWLERELGPVSLELQRGLKRLFDPKNLLNPGKVVTA